jgi:hypothetical protein
MNKVITGIISDAVGLVIWGFSLVLLYQGKIELVWDGILYMVIGSVFFFLGESVITQLLKKLLNGIINLKTKQDGTDDKP